MSRTINEALDYCASNRHTEYRACQKECRIAYGVPSDGTPSAAADWEKSQHKVHETDPMKFPRGVLVRWVGGSKGSGHVAISTGDGNCWSTDILADGHRDHVQISLIHAKWGLTLVGYTYDIDGVLVVEPEAPRKPAKQRPAKVREALKDINEQQKVAGPIQNKKLQKAEDALKSIEKR